MGTHKNEKMVMSGVYLPNEMIFEILSRLPIKSLLRFKCVCKIWCSTIKDPVFIVKHMEQARYEMLYAENQDAKFLSLVTNMGVILEKHRLNDTCRLWNPATKEILYLPPSAEKRKGECTNMCYIQPTNQLKVVYINSSKQGNKEALIYNVLRVGPLCTWKRLDSPLLLDFRNVQSSAQVTPQGISFVIEQPIVWPSTQVIGSLFYNIRRSAYGHYIDCLDLENESIISIKVPQCLFYEWKDVWAVNFKGKLSLARVEQGQLYICVLENYKNHKWADSKIVIPLLFFIDYLSPRISIKSLAPYLVEGNMVYWRTKGYYQLLSFDTESKEVKYLTPPSTKRTIVCMYKPSLLSIHFKVKHPQQKIEIEYSQRQIEESEASLLFKFLRVFRFCLLGA